MLELSVPLNAALDALVDATILSWLSLYFNGIRLCGSNYTLGCYSDVPRTGSTRQQRAYSSCIEIYRNNACRCGSAKCRFLARSEHCSVSRAVSGQHLINPSHSCPTCTMGRSAKIIWNANLRDAQHVAQRYAAALGSEAIAGGVVAAVDTLFVRHLEQPYQPNSPHAAWKKLISVIRVCTCVGWP